MTRFRVRCPLLRVVLATALAVSTAAAVAADSEPPPQEAPADAVRSSSGLASQVLREGSGESPDANDWVMMFYTGWSPAGFKFDSNVGGQPVQVSLEKVSPGWQEGLRLMAVGEKRRLWIPARLAPPTPNAGPAGDVIFDVELLAVFRVPSPPPGLLQPPADAGRTAFGAFTKVLDKGEGAQAVTGVGVLVHYTVWTEDGKVLDSTVPRQRPTLFMWDKVMPAFADALQQMTVGEKRLIWIPAAVAGGQWPGSPRGALTFEAQVVQIMEKDIFAPKPTDAQGGSPHSG